jgi:pilus assembly protein CpaE
MRILAAVCDSEHNDYLMDIAKEAIDVQLVIVHSYEQMIHKLEGVYERIIIHCELFAGVYPWDWMTELKLRQPIAKVMIALSLKTYDSIYNDVIMRLAADYEFTIIPLGLTERDIIEKFTEGLLANQTTPITRNGSLIVVKSASPKDGATTVAVSTALSLAKTTNLSIGLLDLNLKSPDIKDYFNIAQSGKSLFSLRPQYSTNSIQSADILEHCYTYKGYKNLHLLLGSHRRDTAGDLTMEQTKNLLEAAKRTFDIVIADVHTFPDNAATVCAIKHADERWLVTQPSYTSFKISWADWYECFWRHCGLEKMDFSLIVNRSNANHALKVNGIGSDLGMKIEGVLSNVAGGAGIKAVNEGIPLLLAEHNGLFTKEINLITAQLLGRIGSKLTNTKPADKLQTSRLSKMIAMMLAKLE